MSDRLFGVPVRVIVCPSSLFVSVFRGSMCCSGLVKMLFLEIFLDILKDI